MTAPYVLTIKYNGMRFVPDAAHRLLLLRLAEQAQRIAELERLVEMTPVDMPRPLPPVDASAEVSVTPRRHS